MNRIILPLMEFKIDILKTFYLGKFIYSNGGILMNIQKKFWIGLLTYIIISWCIAFHIIWIIFK